eukprot:scaffold48462_cov60-Phaeocystis_antarctica.AAC.5
MMRTEASRKKYTQCGARCGARGRRARAECTSNMLPMSVTLDVSKLRGWLNANAYCRVKAREYGVWGDVRVGRREGVGRERKHSVQGEGLTGHWRRARAERTSNMLCMSVTLDVSKLSGWLNATAYCRVETRAYGVWGEVRDGRREGVGRERKHSVQGEGLTGYWRRARAERTANMSSMCKTLDVSKLSGWLNVPAYCRVETRAYGAECVARCGSGDGRASVGSASGVQGQGLTGHWRRARAERTSNMLSMSVTLDVSKLSSWLNVPAYCRVKARAYGVWGEVRDGRREGVGRERKHS